MTPRTLLTSFSLVVLLATTPGCFYIVDATPDYPRIRSVDGFCDRDDWWELTAEVSHPAGAGYVGAVWVDVTEVWWDQWGEVQTDLGSVDLDYDGDGFWYAELPSSPSFLDCWWAYDYDLTFVAEDLDGDRDSVSITR